MVLEPIVYFATQYIDRITVELRVAVADAGCHDEAIAVWQELAHIVDRNAACNRKRMIVADRSPDCADLLNVRRLTCTFAARGDYIHVRHSQLSNLGQIFDWLLILERHTTEVKALPKPFPPVVLEDFPCDSRVTCWIWCLLIDAGIVGPDAACVEWLGKA